MKQLTSKQAIEFAKSDIWKEWSDEEIVKFQLYQKKLCMDFSRFQDAMEGVLKRPVWTHEFAFASDPGGIIEEYEGKCGKPNMDDIINLIPKEKRILVKSK